MSRILKNKLTKAIKVIEKVLAKYLATFLNI